MVFQNYALYPHMTVYENMAFSLKLRKVKKDEIDKTVREAAGLLEIESLLDRKPKQLSGGQRQRVAIARALVINPDFVVADEPTSMLDVSVRTGVMHLMQNLADRFGVTYLYITHDLAVARYMCDRIAVMYLGKIVELSESHQLYDEPLHPYSQALISAVPIPDPELEMNRERILLTGEIPSPLTPPSGCHFHPRCPDAFEGCADAYPDGRPVGDGVKCACFLYPDPPAA